MKRVLVAVTGLEPADKLWAFLAGIFAMLCRELKPALAGRNYTFENFSPISEKRSRIRRPEVPSKFLTAVAI
jgi:hypothetical protein